MVVVPIVLGVPVGIVDPIVVVVVAGGVPVPVVVPVGLLMVNRGPLGTALPLSLAALDAAISETIGGPVRADRLARDDRVFRWIVRRAIAEGSLRFRCTYAEAAAGAGYPVPRLNCRAHRKEARRLRVSTVYRALCSLRAAGLLRFGGVKSENGQWRCLSIALSPAAYGPSAPFGRSRRRPTRCPGARISFLRRNGTSPPVAKAKNCPRDESVARTRARGPTTEATTDGGGFLQAASSISEAPDPPAWPYERFDLPDPELVEVVELFEELFGIPARFNFNHHGPVLRSILDRFDRYSGAAAVGGPNQRGRREGMRRVRARLEQRARFYRACRPEARKARSLAYFLPLLRQEARKARREWRVKHGFAKP